jgi:hypothetical protein
MRFGSDPHGASASTLAHSLEIPEGARLFVWDAPGDYLDLIAPLPPRTRIIKGLDSDTDVVHVFVRARAALDRSLRTLRATLRPAASIWVSWPRTTAHMKTDVTEAIVREAAAGHDFEAVKMCTVGEQWAALRLVRHAGDAPH